MRREGYMHCYLIETSFVAFILISYSNWPRCQLFPINKKVMRTDQFFCLCVSGITRWVVDRYWWSFQSITYWTGTNELLTLGNDSDHILDAECDWSWSPYRHVELLLRYRSCELYRVLFYSLRRFVNGIECILSCLVFVEYIICDLMIVVNYRLLNF